MLAILYRSGMEVHRTQVWGNPPECIRMRHSAPFSVTSSDPVPSEYLVEWVEHFIKVKFSCPNCKCGLYESSDFLNIPPEFLQKDYFAGVSY